MALNSQRSIARMFSASSTLEPLEKNQPNISTIWNQGQNKRNYKHIDSYSLDKPIQEDSLSQHTKKSWSTVLESQESLSLNPLLESQASQSEAQDNTDITEKKD
jgi:hypothetical protein